MNDKYELSNAKHTPGPWSVQRRDHGAGIGSSYRIVSASGEIAENYDDTDANARLIAAAPELAEALRKIANMSESECTRLNVGMVALTALAKVGL